MPRDILREILDNYNVWHRYQKRLINRAGSGKAMLPIRKKSGKNKERKR